MNKQFDKAFQQTLQTRTNVLFLLTAELKQLIQDFPVVLRAKFKFDADEDSIVTPKFKLADDANANDRYDEYVTATEYLCDPHATNPDRRDLCLNWSMSMVRR